MTESVPDIPTALAYLPTVGGLAVPWVAARTTDGRHLLGVIDQDRADQALVQRLCGVCGRPHGERIVLLLRLSDVPRHCTVEPGLHPWCAHYTTNACPMLAGRMHQYRSSPPPLDAAIRHTDDDAFSRQGSAAEPWFAVWVTTYSVITDHGHRAASYAGTRPLRTRPITWRLPGLF